jgi:predicted metal-dependent phosphoesterase TrpH
MSLEDELVSVWRQVMAEGAKAITVGDVRYPVRRTSRSKLREVDVKIDGRTLRAVEQNPETNSRWAQLARQGRKVMQFMEDRRYVAVVVDGKVTLYGHSSGGKGHSRLEKA